MKCEHCNTYTPKWKLCNDCRKQYQKYIKKQHRLYEKAVVKEGRAIVREAQADQMEKIHAYERWMPSALELKMMTRRRILNLID